MISVGNERPKIWDFRPRLALAAPSILRRPPAEFLMPPPHRRLLTLGDARPAADGIYFGWPRSCQIGKCEQRRTTRCFQRGICRRRVASRSPAGDGNRTALSTFRTVFLTTDRGRKGAAGVTAARSGIAILPLSDIRGSLVVGQHLYHQS